MRNDIISLNMGDVIGNLAWPIAILIIIYWLRQEIKDLLRRLTNFKAAGVSVDAVPSKQSGERKYKQKSKELAKMVSEKEGVVKKLLQIQDETKKNKDYYEILYHFEKTYRLIFGSQLNILRILKNGPIADSLFQSIHRRTPLADVYSFNNYMNFLLNSYLIKKRPADNKYELTLLGFYFLQYLEKNKIPLNKSF